MGAVCPARKRCVSTKTKERGLVNSTVVGFSGLRGGVGTTSMAALLAAALQRSGQSVLLVDLNDSDLLRLRFEIPQPDRLGWCGVCWEGVHWKCQLQSIEENLLILPYGRQVEHPVRVNTQVITSIFTLITDAINADEIPFNLDWVIFDLPSHQTLIREVRSEEHTSELQSRGHLVCRLLLEKKKEC